MLNRFRFTEGGECLGQLDARNYGTGQNFHVKFTQGADTAKAARFRQH